jgi:O-antigen ligase
MTAPAASIVHPSRHAARPPDRLGSGSFLARAIVPIALLGAFGYTALALRTGRVAVAVGVALAGLFVLLSSLRAEMLVAAVVVLSITTLTAGFPLGLPVGEARITVYDVLLVVALVSALRRPAPTHLGPLLPLAGAAAAVGLLLGLAGGASTAVWVDEARSVLYLLAGLLLSRYTTSEHLVARAGLVAGILWISLLVVISNVVLGVSVAASEGQAHLSRGSGGTGSSAVTFAATRYVTVTTHLAVFVLGALLCYAALSTAHRELRVPRLLLLSLFVPAFVLTVLSFSRNTVLGLAAALLFTLLATRSFTSYVALVVKSAGAVAALALLAFLLLPTPTREVASTYAGRVLVGTSLQSLELDPGVQFRSIEVDYATDSVRQHPLFGIGFGTSYRPDLAQDPFPADASTYSRSYVHNWYLWLATKLGLLGLVPVVALFALALARALTAGPASKLLGTGLVTTLAASVVWSAMRSPGMALIVGLCTGCLARRAAATGVTAEGQPSPPLSTSGPSHERPTPTTLVVPGGST